MSYSEAYREKSISSLFFSTDIDFEAMSGMDKNSANRFSLLRKIFLRPGMLNPTQGVLVINASKATIPNPSCLLGMMTKSDKFISLIDSDLGKCPSF